MLSSVLGRLGHTRQPGAMLGRPYVPLRKVTTHVKGQAETTHIVRRAQGKRRAGDCTGTGPQRPIVHPLHHKEEPSWHCSLYQQKRRLG
jgi:hypothetical protein